MLDPHGRKHQLDIHQGKIYTWVFMQKKYKSTLQSDFGPISSSAYPMEVVVVKVHIWLIKLMYS
jgi:hypothetical protein